MALAKLFAQIGIAALKIEARAAARRVTIHAVAGAVAGIFILVAVGFAVAALTVWLAGELGTIWALLIAAALFLVIAGVVLLAARLMTRRRRVLPVVDAAAQRATSTATPPSGERGGPTAGEELGSLAVVALSGFLLAREMFRRRKS